MPAMPPAAPPMAPPVGGGPVPPALNQKLAEAESGKTDMDQRVAELEKKLAEEREKVLLASLRSKEEEAVSAKVENSIKEIQDKLRREKREQEMDEQRRKAEARAIEIERRMAEEREAWVSTLKTQLTQRDQITQEMETHFSTRLKDLEYRWAQEKSALENAVREREAEITRVRHEVTLKAEQEKSFWEDRLRTVSSERDKLDRDLERMKDKIQQEKDAYLMERQMLRESAAKAEAGLKSVEEQFRVEKSAYMRESDANLTMARQQLAYEKEAHEKHFALLQAQMDAHKREASEKAMLVSSLEQQLATLRAQLNQSQLGKSEREKMLEARIEAMTPQNEDYEARRKKYENEIEELNKEVVRLRMTGREEIQKAVMEAEARVKTLQTRLDWYDMNVKREYDNARESVRKEVDELQARTIEAERIASQLRATDDGKIKFMDESKATIDRLEQERIALQRELEQTRNDWKQAQWEVESQVKELNDQLRSIKTKYEQAEDIRITLEQELKQRGANHAYAQEQLEKREIELKRINEKIDTMKKENEFNREKARMADAQVEEYKKIMAGQGLKSVGEVEARLREREDELERTRAQIQKMASVLKDAEKNEEVFKEKERVIRQVISDKDQLINEFRNRVAMVERKLDQVQADYEAFREQSKGDSERISVEKTNELRKVLQQKQQEFEQAKLAAIEEAVSRVRVDAPMGPDPEILRSQVRQEMESEMMSQLRDKETEMESKVAQVKEETKKEFDKIKWEAESMKEELKRAREARAHLEREAQELLQQAEDHYRREMEKFQSDEAVKMKKQTSGFFSSIGLKLGRLLDTPIVDTNKKKDVKKPEGK